MVVVVVAMMAMTAALVVQHSLPLCAYVRVRAFVSDFQPPR